VIARTLILAGAAALAALAAPASAQTPPPAMPDAIRPIRMSGVGLTVSDLERSMRFYTEVLGMKVGVRLPASGPAEEYLLGFTGDIRADALVVLRQGVVQPGATSFGRVVLAVPNGRAMAERVKAGGGDAPKIVDGTNLVRDPDGYMIELYQRPAAKPAAQ
jgi:catechol 2,3-dioxygenase-like lactoylglutathione lyase family enzyme